MGLKGTMEKDHIPLNKFELQVLGLIPIRLVTVAGIEEELETTDLPDRTRASGGNKLPIEFTAAQPMHHTEEVAAMEAWYKTSQDPVSPTYKLPATLTYRSITGQVERVYALSGLFPRRRALPDADMTNPGDMAQITWTFSADDIEPVS